MKGQGRGPEKPLSQPQPIQDAYIPPPRKNPALSSSSPPRPMWLRWRPWIALVVFGSTVILSASAISNAQFERSLANKNLDDLPEDVSDRYHAIAKDFDKETASVEWWSGTNWLRSWLAREARGHVLEMGVGTGRNSRYYKLDKCTSITMIDQAPEMIEIARSKFRKDHPGYRTCRFVTQSAHDPIQHPPEGFDTVIQTMGICSTANPALALQRLGTITNRDQGRILLLEHGRSHWDWLNGYLDKHAPAHADKYGCWWNKDIGKIVEESGLEIVRIKRYQFGTMWWVELKPPSRPSPTNPKP